MTKLKNLLSFIIILVLTGGYFVLNSCYYDNEETLYQFVTPKCDTSNVTYSQTVSAVISSNCNGCHSKAAPSGGIVTDNYNDLYAIATNGKLNGSINHLTGYIAMPQGGNKLTDCNLAKIRIWIAAGAPNN